MIKTNFRIVCLLSTNISKKKKLFTVRFDWIVMVSGRIVSVESEIP